MNDFRVRPAIRRHSLTIYIHCLLNLLFPKIRYHIPHVCVHVYIHIYVCGLRIRFASSPKRTGLTFRLSLRIRSPSRFFFVVCRAQASDFEPSVSCDILRISHAVSGGDGKVQGQKHCRFGVVGDGGWAPNNSAGERRMAIWVFTNEPCGFTRPCPPFPRQGGNQKRDHRQSQRRRDHRRKRDVYSGG